MFNQEQKRILILSSLGGILEFYDFIIYALLANYIAHDFFVTSNPLTSLMATFATFAVGYLVRPFGGIIFGHFGDKFGRKRAFTFSILIMALATFAIGFVPSYASIGVLAPILLTLLRILQGFSIGGEIPGAIVYVSEINLHRRNLACGIIFCALIAGIAIGSLTLAILTSLLSPADMQQWGWRIPFFIGGIFGLISYQLRRQLAESVIFQNIEHDVEAFPFVSVLKLRFLNTIAGIGIVAWGASLMSLLFLFMPSYIASVLKITSSIYVWFNTLGIVIVAILCTISGFIADQFNNKKLLMILCGLTICCAYIIFAIYVHHFEFFYISLLLSVLLTGLAWGVIPGMLTELYPTKIRYSGVAITYNIGLGIFGGLTPLISTILIYQTHLSIAPAFYLIFTALLGLLALVFSRHYHLDVE